MTADGKPSAGRPRMRVQAFLEDLTELSRRTGIVVSGCGCCDSPRLLVDGQPWEWSPAGSYVVDFKPHAEPCANTFPFAQLRWRPAAIAERVQDHDREGLEGAPSLLPVDDER